VHCFIIGQIIGGDDDSPFTVRYWVTSRQVSVAEWLARLTVVLDDPGSNHAADSCVYRDSCCDIQS